MPNKKTPKPWDNITKEELFKRFVVSQHYIKVLEDTFNPTEQQILDINHKLAVSLGIEPEDMEQPFITNTNINEDENKD